LEQFILGMLMVQTFFPLIDGITSVILSGLEAIKGYFGMKIAEYNHRIRKLSSEESDVKNSIGFSYNNQEEEEDE
jgi:hypothetical protein